MLIQVIGQYMFLVFMDEFPPQITILNQLKQHHQLFFFSSLEFNTNFDYKFEFDIDYDEGSKREYAIFIFNHQHLV